MIEFIITILAVVGCTMILVYGTILDKPRKYIMKINFFKELLSCSLCMGFWIGLLFGYITYGTNIKYIVYCGFTGSATCWLYDALVGALQAIEVKMSEKHK